MTVESTSLCQTHACHRTEAWSSSAIRLGLALALGGFVGCSSAEPPLVTMGEAKMAVEQAERDDGHLYAEKSLSDARVKFSEAEKALDKEQFTRARRYAEQAIVDATLARTQADLARAVGTAVEADDALRDVQSR